LGKMRFGKRGIFFTFIAITLMTVFTLLFAPQSPITLDRDAKSNAARIQVIDNYADDLQGRYFETVLRASSYKALLSLALYTNSTGAFISNLDSSFQEVAINGTISKVPIDTALNKKIMENNTLLNWSSRISIAAKEAINVNTTISISNVSISQINPWNAEAVMIFNFTVNSNLAVWNKTNVRVKTTVSIEGLYDPYYFVNTNKAYSNKIKQSSVNFNDWDSSRVREHLRNGTYVHWSDSNAPSFLMRLTNDFSDNAQKSCCGIEALVNPNKVNPSNQAESYADYLFWAHSFNDCTKLYSINVLADEFPNFKLEFEHLSKYNIKGYEATPTC